MVCKHKQFILFLLTFFQYETYYNFRKKLNSGKDKQAVEVTVEDPIQIEDSDSEPSDQKRSNARKRKEPKRKKRSRGTKDQLLTIINII